MRKLISATLMGVVLTGLGIGISGCGEETKETSQAKISTPGGTATTTETKSVKQTGENPPPAPKTP
jgi:hypothetical protein